MGRTSSEALRFQDPGTDLLLSAAAAFLPYVRRQMHLTHVTRAEMGAYKAGKLKVPRTQGTGGIGLTAVHVALEHDVGAVVVQQVLHLPPHALVLLRSGHGARGSGLKAKCRQAAGT